jgi:hypothetical protein
MNCRQIRAKIAQMPDGVPPPEIVAHARECAACERSLSETLGHQKWLRERFAEVSEHLLAHAPTFSIVDHGEDSESSARRGPLFPLAWAAVLLVAALIGWRAWTISPAGTSKRSFAEEPAAGESAERPTEDGGAASKNSDPIAAQKPIEPAPEFSRLADTGSLPVPEEHTLSQRSAQPRPPESSRDVAQTAPFSPAYPPLDTGVYKMEPSALTPNANGYAAAIIPNNATDQAPALVALSLTGAPAESDFYIRTRDESGNYVWLGSGRTDLNGSAVVVMLSGNPTTASEVLTVPSDASEPPVTLNFNGTIKHDLAVVDAAGAEWLTVTPVTAAPITVGPTPVSPAPASPITVSPPPGAPATVTPVTVSTPTKP